MSVDPVWMTRAARQRLVDELAELSREGRVLDADSKSRMVELQTLLERATASAMPDDGLVEPGMAITVEFQDDSSTLTFILGDRTMLGLDSTIDGPVYSPTSPLGAAISGLYVGDRAEVNAPRGQRTLIVKDAHPVT